MAAADSGAMSSPNASPRECLARARGGAQGSETTPGETRGEPAAAKRIGAGDHAHILYSAWKQKVLAGSPAEKLGDGGYQNLPEARAWELAREAGAGIRRLAVVVLIALDG